MFSLRLLGRSVSVTVDLAKFGKDLVLEGSVHFCVSKAKQPDPFLREKEGEGGGGEDNFFHCRSMSDVMLCEFVKLYHGSCNGLVGVYDDSKLFIWTRAGLQSSE